MNLDLVSYSDNLDDGSDSEDVDNLVEPDDDLEEPEQNYKVGDFVLFKFQEKKVSLAYQCITQISDKRATLDCMEKLSKQRRWPAKKDALTMSGATS